MTERARIILFGQKHECEAAERLLCTLVSQVYQYISADTRELLQKRLVHQRPNLAVILSDGAAGMEGVYAVREYDPHLPVFWFSDDGGFAMQSHRLDCAYFADKPLTAEKMKKAFRRCSHLGIHF